MYGYDEELPAGYQDADLEMAELETAGNELAAELAAGADIHLLMRVENSARIIDGITPAVATAELDRRAWHGGRRG